MITRIAIEVAEIGMLGQPLKHLINEGGEREVIYLGSLVEYPAIDAHPC